MTRRQLFSALATVVPALPALHQQVAEAQAITTGATAAHDYARALPDYLHQLAQPLYEQRQDWQAGLSFINIVQQQQRFVRDRFWRSIGGKFESTPLGTKTVGTLARERYKVEKLTYESRPGFLVTANLYLPTAGSPPPFPGILLLAGHGQDGKASPTIQRCCQTLARLGYAVLIFDPLGQGERRFYRDQQPALSATQQHSQLGRQLLLVGDTCTRWILWDAIRSLDVLASHPQVDPARLAAAGQSGGGTATMFLAAVEDRLTTAWICMGITENFLTADFQAPGSVDDAEQNLLPLSSGERLDRWDLLLPFAPHPLSVSVSSRDAGGTYSPAYVQSGREEVAALRQIYGITGRPADLEWAEYPLPHGLGYQPRLELYRWMHRHLKVDRSAIEQEPPTQPEPAEALWSTEHGDVVKAGSRTPWQLIVTPIARKNVLPLRAALTVADPPKATAMKRLATAPAAFGQASAIEIASVPPVWLPIYTFEPKRPRTDGMYLVLDERGRRNQAPEDSLSSQLAQRGYLTYAADLRGLGELTPELPRGPADHARSRSDEEYYAWASLMLGRSLPGQRVTDILAVVQVLAQLNQPLTVVASGRLTVPALWAAALEPRITGLALYGGLASFRHILATPYYRQPFSIFVPGIADQPDLPELATKQIQADITLAAMQDGTGKPLPEKELRDLYPKARIQSAASWNSVDWLTAR